jgi:Ca-activated chloride channel family protein
VKLSIAMVASLVGMIGTSVGVSWVMGPPARASEAVATAWTPPAAGAEPAASVAADTTAPSSSFVREGVLRVDARVGHPVLPAGASGETFVLVDVQATPAEDVTTRAPANIAIVLDRSASMRGRKMTNAMAGLRGMLAELGPDDTVSIVTYADKASVLLPTSTIRSLDLGAVGDMLDRVRSGGHTCMSCGITLARLELRRRTGAVNRMLLLSDGLANRGIVEPSQFRVLADGVRSERAAIASIGVDIDYDERTLLALSEGSNGRHYFVANPAGLGAVFEQERRALVGSVADDVEVEFTLADGVELLEVVDRPHRLDDGRVRVSLGTFAAGEQRTALLRVRVAGAAGAVPVADVQLAWRDLGADRNERIDGALALRFEGTEAAPLDPAVDARLGRKDTFDALISANAAFARGDLAATRRELERARRTVTKRKAASASAGPKHAADFDQQIRAIEQASTGFDEAARDVPAVAPIPATASQGASKPRPLSRPAPAKTKKGKTITRQNASAADPFSN